MSLLTRFRNWIEDPPPAFAFEFSPKGIAHWQATTGGVRFEPFELDLENLDAELLAAKLRQITPAATGGGRRPAAVILPDKSARVSLMDFDMFPRKPEEQQSLVRFRLKRTVPFDVDTAVIRYQAYVRGGNKVELVVSAMAVEVLAPFEAAFRQAGFHPGFITVSGLSQANLGSPGTLGIRLCAGTFTLNYIDGEELRLFRSLELNGDSFDEILNVLDPTLAYLEDERRTKPQRAELCGLTGLEPELGSHLRENWNIPVQQMRARAGMVDGGNAGLMGYLESTGAM
jgi:type IV pilus assembly protein PilM